MRIPLFPLSNIPISVINLGGLASTGTARIDQGVAKCIFIPPPATSPKKCLALPTSTSIVSNVVDSDPTKKCHKTNNKSNKLNIYL